MNKNPKFSGVSPQTYKKPRIQSGPAPNGRPVWAVARIDFGGPWCPKKMPADVLADVLDKLKGFERMSWPEIGSSGSHFIPLNMIVKEARQRLVELNLDDTDELYSLRVSGKVRLWGLRSNDKFSLLWWDPDHEICPSLLKHT